MRLHDDEPRPPLSPTPRDTTMPLHELQGDGTLERVTVLHMSTPVPPPWLELHEAAGVLLACAALFWGGVLVALLALGLSWVLGWCC